MHGTIAVGRALSAELTNNWPAIVQTGDAIWDGVFFRLGCFLLLVAGTIWACSRSILIAMSR